MAESEFYIDERYDGNVIPSIGYWGDIIGGSNPRPPINGELPSWGGERLEESNNAEWSGNNMPFLKTAPDGFLLTDGERPELLAGSRMCCWPPQVIIWIQGDDEHIHTRCLLLKADIENSFSLDKSPELTEKQKNSGMCSWGYLDWLRPGTINFSAKWQSGHYEHEKISKVRFAVLGFDSGYRTLALTRYVKVFTIKITENYEIYVNNIRGSLTGNRKFVE